MTGKKRIELRRVEAWVEVDGERRKMVFLTNNLNWSPRTVCDLCKRRWDIEVFFKQVKQSLWVRARTCIMSWDSIRPNRRENSHRLAIALPENDAFSRSKRPEMGSFALGHRFHGMAVIARKAKTVAQIGARVLLVKHVWQSIAQ